MSMVFQCDFCSEDFKRPPSQVKGKNKFCSHACKNEWQREGLTGKNNPNYKEGLHSETHFCKCGEKKDYRAKSCWSCAGRTAVEDKDDQDILQAIKASDSYVEASNRLGLGRTTVARYIKGNKVDVSHMRGARGRDKDIDDIFIEGAKRRRNGTLKRYIFKYNLIEYKCAIEDCTSNKTKLWNNKALTLQLDHINGDAFDNRLENLRFLCPNCHSQTKTYCGKNSSRHRGGDS